LGSALVVAAAFGDDDGVGGRAADGPQFVVVELDRERVLADVDGSDPQLRVEISPRTAAPATVAAATACRSHTIICMR
jgi:hypothetical protein